MVWSIYRFCSYFKSLHYVKSLSHIPCFTETPRCGTLFTNHNYAVFSVPADPVRGRLGTSSVLDKSIFSLLL